MKFISKLTILFFFCLYSVQFVNAMKVDDISPTDYVTDYTSTLSTEQVLELSKILGNIEKQKGYQIGIVVIDKMEDEYGHTDYIEHFAVKLYEKLGLGSKEKDEGMLWLISKNDRQMRMEVGYGLESVLTDGVTKNIQDNIVRPEFKNGNYFEGIKTGVDNIANILNTGVMTENISQINENIFGDFFQIFVMLILFGAHALAWFGAIMARTKSWWLGGLLGAAVGAIIYFSIFSSILGIIVWVLVTVAGTVFDYLISKNYKYWERQYLEGNKSARPAWWAGGAWGPSSSGTWSGRGGSGFGGFGGGGMSGGGGSSSSW